jgi:hypothetical protein
MATNLTGQPVDSWHSQPDMKNGYGKDILQKKSQQKPGIYMEVGRN